MRATEVKGRFLQFYQANETLVSFLVFAAGFIFDLITLGRIDDLLNLIQQGIYLLILGTFLLLEIRIRTGKLTLKGKAQRWWQYHDLVVHFLFGSLLSAYTIFYYTSASALTSFLFILLLAGLMCANEIPRFQQAGLPVRVILYNICVLSYFAFFYPILLGRVGQLPFWLGFLTSAILLGIVWYRQFQKEEDPLLKKHVALPSVLVHLFFIAAYYLALIPPVPVAVKKIGVYYQVEKVQGEYLGYHQRPFWKFWENGSQDFAARPGDKVVVLLSIFSPARFEDKIYLNWFYDDPKIGWRKEDSIPLSILGGREEGFRGFGIKSHYRPGDWKVTVETSDGRQVGNIRLSISEDNSRDDREFKTDAF